MTDEGAPSSEGSMSIVEHLGELRSRLIRSVLAVAAGAVVGWILFPEILDVLLEPYCDTLDPGQECRLLQTDPLEGFSVRVRVAAYTGVALAMPVLLFQVWRFVTPGLYSHERRLAVPFILGSLTLFVLGAGLAYWTLPRALDFLVSVGGSDFEQFFSPAPYIRLITYMMLAFGIGFEFPILLVFLQLLGIVETDTLRRGRRYAVIGIVVLVAVVTPSGDPYSLAALSVPMYVFYEASIVAGRIMARRRARSLAG